jgi:outer membrane protein OmpA-like peptidoglycan-associated protein
MQKNYFKSIAFAAIACLIAAPAQAQSPGTHSLELSGGIREYMGDLGSSVGFARRPDYQGGQVNFGYYVSPALDLVTNFSFGEIGYSRKWEGFNLRKEYQWQSFRANTMDLTVGARYKLNNGSILPEDAKIAPYFQAGVGGFYAFSQTTWGPDAYVQDEFYADVTKKRAVTDMNGAVQGAFGVNVYLTERIGLRYSFTATYTMSDIWDGANGGTPDPVNNIAIHKLWRTNDMYALHAIGFTYAIGEGMGTSVKKPKDKDEDGVPDKYDLCKNTEPKYRRFVDSVGCPADTDKDGILDADDKCPDVAGPEQFKGCPDADGDGIQDKLDACPNQAGDAKFNGCPDTDGDGVSDKDDACPTTAGLAAFGGCPDTDGDGVEDRKDKCPNLAGAIAGEGCPDTDGDGVFNNIDKCPDVAGAVANKGCPEIKKEVIQKIALAAKGINFETGKAVITAGSFKSLDDLVTLLNSYPGASVEIQGHTDNNGTPESNKTLSQDRANSVKRYLSAGGVSEARMTAIGYGQEVPLADNKTEAGKTKNRRVDFKLVY